MQMIGRWLSGFGPDQVKTQDDMARRVDAVIEHVNATVARAKQLPAPPDDQMDNEAW